MQHQTGIVSSYNSRKLKMKDLIVSKAYTATEIILIQQYMLCLIYTIMYTYNTSDDDETISCMTIHFKL